MSMLRGIPQAVPSGTALVVVAQRSALARMPFILGDRETQRARTIPNAETHARFVQGRTLLRSVLGHMLFADPRGLDIDIRAGGKPVLTRPASSLTFSITMGENLAAVAIASDVEIGIDVEERAPPDCDAVALVILSDAELAEYSRTPASERDDAFLRAWTRKEAILKATGHGFATDPRTVDLGLGGTSGLYAGEQIQVPVFWSDVPGLRGAFGSRGVRLEPHLVML